MNNAAEQTSQSRNPSHGFILSFYEWMGAKICSSGITRHPLGRSVYATLNRVARRCLMVYLDSLHPKPVIVRGQRMRLVHRDSTNLGVTLKMLLGDFEPGTMHLIERIVKPGMVVVDIGAHVGYHTLLAARLAGPNGKVYAFEPDAGNYQLLVENIEMNGYTNVDALPRAVADRSGRTSFFLSAWGSDRNSLYQDNSGLDARRVEVETTTLDDFMATIEHPSVDLVKMDIEGAELAALEGMKDTLNRTRSLILEFSPVCMQASSSKPERLLDLLTECGFGIKVIGDDGTMKPLESIDFPTLVEGLIRSRKYVNLFCEKNQSVGESEPIALHGVIQQSVIQ